MLDFSSALYLGLHHRYTSLPVWPGLSTGKPAVLDVVEGTDSAQRELAALMRCDRALLAPSTLHLFVDLFLAFGKQDVAFLLDEDAYPVACRAARCATGTGAVVETFGPRCGKPLNEVIRGCRGRRPVIVTDGFFPLQGRYSPLSVYGHLARAGGGFVVVDDTQALGIFGSEPGSISPYGTGGGGSLRHAGLEGGEFLLVASLAKGFGVPVGVLAGPRCLMERFERRSFTRMHCSAASAAMISAVGNAMLINHRQGEWLRRRLASRVSMLQRGLRELGLSHTRGLFPVQSIESDGTLDVIGLASALDKVGVSTVLTREQPSARPKLSFIVTAEHSAGEMDQALEYLGKVVERGRACAV